MDKNIRDLENMPLNIRFLYGKILGTMVCSDNNYNQLKLAGFYRIISKIQLPIEERIQLINLIIKNHIQFPQVCDEIDLNEYLNSQEKNIFRFSLMKDLIIVMKADYVETYNEKKLLEEIQQYFNVSHEQLSFFTEEYKLDRHFLKDNISNNQLKNISVDTISTGVALGIPLATLYYSGTFKGLNTLGIISGFKAIDIKKRRRKGKNSFALGLTTYVLLGITTYKITKYILNIKKDEKTKLVRMVRKNIEALHENTKNIIYEDIGYFTNHIARMQDKEEQDLKGNLEIVDILERVAATLENTGAIIL